MDIVPKTEQKSRIGQHKRSANQYSTPPLRNGQASLTPRASDRSRKRGHHQHQTIPAVSLNSNPLPTPPSPCTPYIPLDPHPQCKIAFQWMYFSLPRLTTTKLNVMYHIILANA